MKTKYTLSLLFSLLIVYQINAQSTNAVSNGSWNSPSTWSCGCVPDANYDITISGYTVKVTDVQAAKSVLLTDNPNRNTQLNINGGTLKVNGDLNVDVNDDNRHMDVVIQGAGILNVGGDVFFDRSTNNTRNKRMQLKMQDDAVMNVSGQFDFIYGDAADSENSYEIWMQNNSRINITGDFAFRQTDDGNDATLRMEDNSYIDVNGNMYVSLDNGDRTEIYLYNNAILDVAGNLTMENGKNTVADDRFNFYMYNASQLLVGGDLNIYQDRNRSFYFDLNNSSVATISGDMNVTQDGNDDIFFYFDNNASLTVNGRLYVDKNGGDDISFQVNNTATVTIKKDFYSVLVLNSDMDYIDLNGGSFTVTDSTYIETESGSANGADTYIWIDDATFTTGGLHIFHNDGDDFYVRLSQNSSAAPANLIVKGNFIWDFQATNGNDNFNEIHLYQPVSNVSITGNYRIIMNANGNDDYYMYQNNGTFTANGNLSYTVNGIVDADLFYYIDNGSHNISGNVVINHNEGDDVLIYLNNGNSNTATPSLSIGGNFIYNHDGPADDLLIQERQQSTISISGDFIETSVKASDDYSRIELINPTGAFPKFIVSGNMTRTSTAGGSISTEDDIIIDVDGGTFTVGNTYISMDGGDDITLDIDGGVLTFGTIDIVQQNNDDISFDIDNGASLTSLDDIRIHNISGDDAKFYLNVNDGSPAVTVTIADSLILDNEKTSDDMKMFMYSSSQMTAGNIYMENNSSSNNTLRIYTRANATLNVTNNIVGFQNEGNGSNWGDDLQLHIYENSQLNVGGDIELTQNSGDDVEFYVTDNADVSVSGNLTLNQTGGNDMQFRMTDLSNTTVTGNINMTAPADNKLVVDLNESSYLKIGGNFVRQASPNKYGSLTMEPGTTVEYNGATNTQIVAEDYGDGADGFYYSNVVINNTYATYPQLTTEGKVTINNSLTLTDGIVQTTSANIIEIANDATSTQGSLASFVDGPIQKVGSSAFVFPTGDIDATDGPRWARIEISAPTKNSTFSAEYISDPHPNWADVGTLNNVSTKEYWMLDRITGTGSVRVSLYWEDGTWSGINDLTPTDLVVAHFNGTVWQDEGGSYTGTTAAGKVTSSNVISTFSPFTFGSRGGGVNPLPVELLDFTAVANEETVDITWKTATEINNDYFVVQRSKDGKNWEDIIRTRGAGNSNKEITYFEKDYQPYKGISYYRLKQVDYDGKETYFNIVPVEILTDNTESLTGLEIFPNPSDGEQFNLFLKGLKDKEVLVVVRDLKGAEHYAKVVIVQSENQIEVIDPDKHLAPGIYLVTGSSENILYSKKLIVK